MLLLLGLYYHYGAVFFYSFAFIGSIAVAWEWYIGTFIGKF